MSQFETLIDASLRESHFNLVMLGYLHSITNSAKSCLRQLIRPLRATSLGARRLTLRGIYTLALLLVIPLRHLIFIKRFIYKTHTYTCISIDFWAKMLVSVSHPYLGQLNLFRLRLR